MRLPLAYLTERITLDDFEASHSDFRADWLRLLSKRTAGDELWRFASPPGQIDIRGIALVRRGKVVSTLIESVG